MEEADSKKPIKKAEYYEISNLWMVGSIIIILLIGAVYFLAIRPNNERKACSNTAFSQVRATSGVPDWTDQQILSTRTVAFDDYNHIYLACLNSKGL